MNNRALTLSVVMGILAVFFVQSYVTSIEDGARKKFGTEVLVVAAKQDIEEMGTIDETMLELKPIPKTFLEPAAMAYTKGEDEQAIQAKIKELAGYVASVPIRQGEQLTLNKIVEPSIRTGLAPQVTPGRRAIAIQVNDISAVSKLLKPGDRVDLTAVVEVQANARANPLATKLAKTILQDIVILAVGQSVTNNAPRIFEKDGSSTKAPLKMRSLVTYNQYTTVTIEVEPAQAQMLALLNAGALVLTLRNNDDSERVGLAGMTMMDVLGADAVKILPPPPQAAPVARKPAGGK
ncbi:MAG: Flp pilus assembly protein CpaB [Bdellovibrionales bacterium]|nr:Flp pilus assembly protein CpaB [Bdellovibrionales bacterium]